jgi:hypothetical protein
VRPADGPYGSRLVELEPCKPVVRKLLDIHLAENDWIAAVISSREGRFLTSSHLLPSVSRPKLVRVAVCIDATDWSAALLDVAIVDKNPLVRGRSRLAIAARKFGMWSRG